MKTDPNARARRSLALVTLPVLFLSACAAVTVPVKVVTLPVKATLGAVDIVTRDAHGF